MASLKSALPAFAKALEMSPAALYERQRALVRAELLEMKPGHGPGSGVLATPHSIAMLLIAVAATGSLTETGELTQAFANLKSKDKKCPLTGKRTFGAAFTAILDSELLRKRLAWIDTTRSGTKYSGSIVLRKDSAEYYTSDELEHLYAKGQKPDPEKIHATIGSDFGELKRRSGGNMTTHTTLFLNWLNRILVKENK